MITEKEYSASVGIEHRKKFAQFFTPQLISDFMAGWIVGNKSSCQNILEPAFGLGIFSRSILSRNNEAKIIGYDIDDKVLSVAFSNFADISSNVSIFKQDYLESDWEDKYDGIICNPPYLKFHDYDNSKYIPLVNSQLGICLNGFTNIYTLFLIKSLSQLKKGGRLAYIVPLEFLNSDYGVEVKRFLLQSNSLKHLIIVDFQECAFDDALTTACILLCENNGKSEDVKISTVKDIAQLNLALDTYTLYSIQELDPEVKWKKYYEGARSSKYCHLVPFKTFAKVSRGIATGANEFFTLSRSTIQKLNISPNCAIPCICHAQDVKSQIFTLDDYKILADNDKSVFLFDGCAAPEDPNTARYINIGEEMKYNTRYLCACRKPWYAIEKREPAPIWVSVFNRAGLRFVRNEANIRNLTTFHCVYNISSIDTDILFAYLLTNTAQEIFLDNSRQYGNGLTKFEPNDLNKGMSVDLRLLTDTEKDFIMRIYRSIVETKFKDIFLIQLLDRFFLLKFTDQVVNYQDLDTSLSSHLVNI